jgi:hypothetical protein
MARNVETVGLALAVSAQAERIEQAREALEEICDRYRAVNGDTPHSALLRTVLGELFYIHKNTMLLVTDAAADKPP